MGPICYDQTDPYDPQLIDQTIAIGREAGATMQRGVFVFTKGPRYESRADIHVLHTLGADAVGMSTVPDVLALSRAGVSRIIGLAGITNMAAGITTSRITEQEINNQQALVRPQVQSILSQLVEAVG